MSLYAPIIRASRLRAGLLESQAEQIADENPTASLVLSGLAVVEEQVANGLETEERERADALRPATT